MPVDLFKARIVPPDKGTEELLGELRRSKDWNSEDLHELDRLQAFAYAQIPRQYWDLSTQPIQDRSIVRKLHKYAKNFQKFIHEDHLGLLFHGESGRGKSFLAAHISMRVIEAGFSVWFYDYQKFRSDMLEHRRDEDYQARIKSILRLADVVIFNDFNFVNTSPKEREVLQGRLYNICRSRHTTGALIIVHRGPGAKGPLENHTHSVLKEMVYPIHVKGPDLRDGSAQQKFDSAM